MADPSYDERWPRRLDPVDQDALLHPDPAVNPLEAELAQNTETKEER